MGYFFLTKKNGLCSDSGMITIISNDECKKASIDLFNPDTYKGPLNSASKPKGCYWRSGGESAEVYAEVYLNEHVVGSRNGITKAICRGK